MPVFGQKVLLHPGIDQPLAGKVDVGGKHQVVFLPVKKGYPGGNPVPVGADFLQGPAVGELFVVGVEQNARHQPACRRTVDPVADGIGAFQARAQGGGDKHDMIDNRVGRRTGIVHRQPGGYGASVRGSDQHQKRRFSVLLDQRLQQFGLAGNRRDDFPKIGKAVTGAIDRHQPGPLQQGGVPEKLLKKRQGARCAVQKEDNRQGVAPRPGRFDVADGPSFDLVPADDRLDGFLPEIVPDFFVAFPQFYPVCRNQQTRNQERNTD